ncbi:MAG: bacterial domain protein [Acidimicrobiaceae bacterium]|nr:bacterial domain protein [Acidimicrobiaceae bacterium]
MRGLEQDEEVLYASRPHAVVLVRPVAAVAVLLAACVAGFLAWSDAPAWFGVLLAVAVLFAAAYLSGRVLRYRSSLLMVTTLRVVQREGFWRRSGREVPAARVEDVSYEQGPLGRLLGYGSLLVESASATRAAPLAHVRRPEDVQHRVHQAAEHARQGGGPMRSSERWAPPAGDRRPAPRASEERRAEVHQGGTGNDVGERLARLEALRRRGIVTEAEFDQKRAELLGGL